MEMHGRSGCVEGAQPGFQLFEGTHEDAIIYPPYGCVGLGPDINCRNAKQGGNRQAEGSHQPCLTPEAEPHYAYDTNSRYLSPTGFQQIETKPEHALSHGSDPTMNTNDYRVLFEKFVRADSAPWSPYDQRQSGHEKGVGGTGGDTEFAQDIYTSSFPQGNQVSFEVDQSLMVADRKMHEAGAAGLSGVPPDLFPGLKNMNHIVGLPSRIPSGGGSGLAGMDNVSVHPSLGGHSLSSRPSAPSRILSSTASDTLSCSECGSKFTGRHGQGNLQRHRRLKHKPGVAPLQCEYKTCVKMFRRSDARLNHYRKAHGIPK